MPGSSAPILVMMVLREEIISSTPGLNVSGGGTGLGMSPLKIFIIYEGYLAAENCFRQGVLPVFPDVPRRAARSWLAQLDMKS